MVFDMNANSTPTNGVGELAPPDSGGKAWRVWPCLAGCKALAHGPDADVVGGFSIEQAQQGPGCGCKLKVELGEVVFPVEDGPGYACGCKSS